MMGRHKFLPHILLLVMVHYAYSEVISINKGVEDVIINLAQISNTDIHFISDSSMVEMNSIPMRLAEENIPVFTYKLADLVQMHKKSPQEKCPMVSAGHGAGHGDDHGEDHGGEDHHDDDHHGEMLVEDLQTDDTNYYTIAKENPNSFARPSLQQIGVLAESQLIPKSNVHRRPTLLASGSYHRTVVIWVDQVKEVLRMFSETAMFCQQRVDVGVYDPSDSFIFIVENDQIREEIFQDPYIQKHSKVAAIRKITDSPDRFIGFTYNFFQAGEIIPRFIWRKETPLTATEQVFTSLDDFQNYEFHVGVLPWSHHVLGDKIEAPEGTPATYENYWGYEIDLLESIAKRLKFRYKFSNVEDGKWGHIEADATWSGMVAQAAWGDVDFVICDMFLTYIRMQVIDGTISFDKDYMVFVAPNPQQNPKYLALIQPLQAVVWFLILTSLAGGALFFLLISKTEEKIVNLPLKAWASIYESVWYVFGTLLGENMTRDANSAGANAIRWVIGIWILYCFVIGSAYSGSLKAFLTTPGYSSPIDSLGDVLESGLPWGMVLYGEEEEEMMASSPLGSAVRTIWDDKNIKPYSPTVAEVDNVFHGESIFIDWKSGLEPAIFVKYSTPGGDPLVHLASNPVFMPNFPGWGFYKFNPWRAKFDQIIRQHIEAGFIDEWKWRTWARQKKEALARGDQIDFQEIPVIAPLTLDDMQSAFWVEALFSVLATLAFCVEICSRMFYTPKLMKLLTNE